MRRHALLLLTTTLLLHGCKKGTDDSGQDSQVAVNEAPSCAITEPATGAAGVAGDAVTFGGTAQDPDGDWGALTLALVSDLDGDLGAIGGDESGWTLSTSALSLGTHALTLTVTDADGGVCEADSLYTVGEPPAVAIESPATDDVLGTWLNVELEGWVSDDDDAASDLAIAWEHADLGVLDETPAAPDGTVTLDADLDPGEHTITLTATDALGFYGQASVTFTVNGSPTAPTVSIEPAAPGSDQALVAQVDVDATDPEDDALTHRYTWLVDGVDSLLREATVAASETARGEVWTVQVVAFDGVSEGPPAEASAVVGNAPPTIGSVTITPSTPLTSDSVWCAYSGYADVDGDADASVISWALNGTDVGTGNAFPGGHVHGDVLTCTVTPSDGTDTGTPVSASETAANTAPVLADATLSPTTATEGSTLTCTPGASTDADGEAVTTSIAWTVDSSAISTTGATLTGSDFDKGDAVACVVTPSDGTDSGAAVTSSSVTISNTAPTAPTVTLSPSSPSASDTLTCTASGSTDDDGDTLSYAYVWTVDGVTDSNTASTLPSTSTNEGEDWQCFVTASDGTDSSSQSSSSAVTIGTSTVVFDITRGMLNNQVSSCSSTLYDTVYNGCSGDWGFTWTDSGSSAPTAVTVDLYHGLNCSSSTSKVTDLNGVGSGTFTMSGGSCSCNPTNGQLTWALTDVSGYTAGGSNTFTIGEDGSCEGLSINTAWGSGVYAQVTVEY